MSVRGKGEGAPGPHKLGWTPGGQAVLPTKGSVICVCPKCGSGFPLTVHLMWPSYPEHLLFCPIRASPTVAEFTTQSDRVVWVQPGVPLSAASIKANLLSACNFPYSLT